jgi:thiol-disulfide isomerase/thioredoxin
VVLNFWAGSCSACLSELPQVEQASRDLAGKAAVVGIDVADGAGAAGLAEQLGVTYPLAADAGGSVAGAYQISGLPFTVVLGPKGRVLVRHPGTITAEQLDYVIHTLESEPPAA